MENDSLIAESRTCPWNKLADHPPVVGRRCLVFLPKKDRDNPELMTVATFTERSGWWPISLTRQDDITHWMDLPGPPVG